MRNELDEAHDTPVDNSEMQARLRAAEERARELDVQLEQSQRELLKHQQAEAELRTMREQVQRQEKTLDDRAASRARLQR